MLCDCDQAEVENTSTVPAESNAHALRLKACTEFNVDAGDAVGFAALRIKAKKEARTNRSPWGVRFRVAKLSSFRALGY
jgi:hypothetical protein